jgi:hypothetical protein
MMMISIIDLCQSQNFFLKLTDSSIYYARKSPNQKGRRFYKNTIEAVHFYLICMKNRHPKVHEYSKLTLQYKDSL